MTGMYESYVKSANELTIRINALSDRIASEENLENLYALKARRRLLIEERFDLLDIAKSLRTGTIWGDFY